MKHTLIAFITVLSIAFSSCSENEIVPSSETLNDSASSPFGLVTNLSITVMSPNWDNTTGITCPDEVLELEAYGGTAPYTWTIQGATIISGQGTSTVFIRTADTDHDLYQYYKVKDGNNTIATKSGKTDHMACYFFCDEYPEAAICNGGNVGEQH